MKKFLFFILCLSWFSVLRATHNRAGEITYRYINGYTYEVTITTYTKESSQADRCELTINWGDSTSSILKRVNGAKTCSNGAGIGESIGNDVKKNIYKGTHTYNSSGSYVLWFEDPNRNAGVSNIPQSVSVPFYVQSELLISPGLGHNSSPVLLNPPIDDGCLNQRFEHNPGAFDIDGDSLSYRLVNCRTAGGAIIPTIYDPQYVQDEVKIDSVKGDLYWDVPKQIGQYNFAIEIDEWRKNGNGEYVRIGYVTRDLQVNIKNCNNQPPQIQPVGPFCVEAGQNLNFDVTATDPDAGQVNGVTVYDKVTLSAYGGPFQVLNPADPFGATGTHSVTANFNWNTACNHVRKQPYFITFQATDDPSERTNSMENPLVDIYTTQITVVAPAPQNPSATGSEAGIQLQWDPSICTQADGYEIYRREGSYGFVHSDCETGVPAYTGYKLIDTISGLNNTSYLDTFELKRGVQYCYMVVATFPDESESYASIEFCASLPLTTPMMTNVDVVKTDPTIGIIGVKWIAPPVIDSLNFPPPYSYKLYRADHINGNNFSLLQSFPDIQDTSYVDSTLNTQDQGYNYKVEFYSGSNSVLVGTSDPASSVFLKVVPSDQSNILRMTHSTPWKNNRFVIYRETSPGSGIFDSIAQAFSATYIDTGLANGDNYCYRTKTIGAYTANTTLPAPLINNSQEACGTPLDTNAPCPPILRDSAICAEDYLYLYWENPQDSGCMNDIAYYNLYYKSRSEEHYPATPMVSHISTPYYTLKGMPIVGCYAITAVDDAANDPNGSANESSYSNEICISACPAIYFPNIFTPNGDGKNDFFIPIKYKDIGEISLKIFNRWGTMVYKTDDVNTFFETGWDGRDMNTHRPSPDGVYFFTCTYTPLSLESPQQKVVTGFVHLVHNQ